MPDPGSQLAIDPIDLTIIILYLVRHVSKYMPLALALPN